MARADRGGHRSVPARLAAYFKYGHSAQRLSKIRQYARMRLALFISKKHPRSRNFGWRVLSYPHPATSA